MKKIIIIVVVFVIGLFVVATDMVVNPVHDWVKNNHSKSFAPRLQYTMAGYLYMVAQRQEKAVELYNTAFQLFPGHKDEAEAHYRVGLYYESKKDYVNATKKYELILAKWPDLGEKLALNQRIAKFRAYSGEAD